VKYYSFAYVTPPSLVFNMYRGFPPGVKSPGHEVDYPRPSGAEVKGVWNCAPIPLICLHGVERENFTSYLCQIMPRNIFLSYVTMWMYNVPCTHYSFQKKGRSKNFQNTIMIYRMLFTRSLWGFMQTASYDNLIILYFEAKPSFY
jgi:hypothetical protein